MMRGGLALALTVVALVACKKSNTDSTHSPLHEQQATRVATELSQLGFRIDLSKLSFEVRTVEDSKQDMDRQQDMFFAKSYFDGLRMLRRLWLLPSANSAVEFRQQAVDGVLDSIQAYYQPDRNALVFLRTTLDALIDQDALIAHELVHAYQDQHFGIETLLSKSRISLERSTASQIVMEGHAEAISTALLLARQGKTLSDVDPGDFDDGLARMFSGDAALPYTVGRAVMLRAFHKGGWPAVEAILRAPPSTEQLLHPGKLGRDEPTPVELRAWPSSLPAATVVHEDEIGEMMIYSLLLEYGVPDVAAYVASTGWDGDKFRVYDIGNGRRAAVWRIVFDRPVDAEQFVSVTREAGSFRPVQNGRAVDAVFAEIADVSIALQEVLVTASPPSSPASINDAVTTKYAEEQYIARQASLSVVIDGRWVVERAGVAVSIPVGWQVTQSMGMNVLAGPETGGFRDNVTVVAQPNLEGLDIAAFKQQHLDTMGSLDDVTLDETKIIERDGQPMLLLEYHGRPPTSDVDLHFTSLLALQGGRYVVVTATVLEDRWEEVGPTADWMLAGLAIRP